jgi:hypothetical protein
MRLKRFVFPGERGAEAELFMSIARFERARLKPCPFKDFGLQLPKQMNNSGEAPLYPYSPDYTILKLL